MLGIVSLLQIEKYLSTVFRPSVVNVFIAVNFILCGYGIYVGRYLRFNSWDVVANADDLLAECFQRLLHPFQHLYTWSFSILFAFALGLFYYTLKAITVMKSSDASC